LREGYVLKSSGKPQENELVKINRYTRREFQADEVYTFSVVLCDNEIDRDNERFTKEALEKLAVLFLGKTGIFNHSMETQNQTARIYDCRVETDKERLTKTGEGYSRLVAQAYLPKSEKNNDFILEIESGIKKEVSVGCAMARAECSICGADLKQTGCEHRKGKSYAGKTCCTVLSEPTDAYEWSFVAVPAQREAGVIKSFSTNTAENVENLQEMLSSSGATVTLTKTQGRELLERMETLKKDAECGKLYRDELKKNFLKYGGIAQPGIPREVMARVAGDMKVEDLKCFEEAYRKKAGELLPLHPQLAAAEKAENSCGNAEFRI
jgi:hypothetical protein